MSSPKRVARGAVRRATNAASRGGTVKQPAKSTAKADNGASAEAKRLAAAIERSIAAGRLNDVSADALQALMAAACRVYAARRQAGEDFAPIAKHTISATDIMITASGLLRAADLSTFELGMWQGFTGR
jgi:4-hydroxy-L-threonine phosphate dehydrogenase PdxA